MKILALDLGDTWVGSALSDSLKITCKPHETVLLDKLFPFLTELFASQSIEKVIVGYPKTVSAGLESAQTRKIVALKETLEQTYPQVPWILWDERLSSKRADQLKRATNKQEKIQSHSVAAAFILQGYLDFLAFSAQ